MASFKWTLIENILCKVEYVLSPKKRVEYVLISDNVESRLEKGSFENFNLLIRFNGEKDLKQDLTFKFQL